jgi:RecB family exonuclease
MMEVFSYVKLSSLRRALLERNDGRAARVYVLPSRSNEDILLDMLRRSGNYFASRPEVWSWQDIYNRAVPKAARRRCVDPPDHYLVLRYVRDALAGEMESEGRHVPPGMARDGFIVTLGEAVNEMLLEDVAPEAIRGHDMLYRLYSGYLSYLESHGLADNSQLPSLALRALGDALPKAMRGVTLVWTGFMSLTGAQLKLARELSALGAVMEFYVPDSGGANFRDAASQLGVTASSVETGGCAARAAVCADAYAQWEYTADFAAGAEDADCGILAEPGAIQAIGAALSRRGVPWQSRSEITVDRTALMDLAHSAWETGKLGWPPARTANLMRGAAIGAEIDDGRFSASMPEGMDAWREFFSGDEAALEALSRLASFHALLGREEGNTAEELLRGLYALSGGGWDERLAREAWDDMEMDPAIREITSSRLEIEGKLAMMEEAVPALGEASLVRFSGDGALEFLAGWAREAATALPPRYKGVVALYDSPPPVLASHSVWIMTGVDASRYPGSASDHALLSEELREAVNASQLDSSHLPTTGEKRSQKEAMFRRLLAVGESVTLTARAAADASGSPVSESPFMRRENFAGTRWDVEGESVASAPERAASRVFRKFPRAATAPAQGKARVPLSQIDRLLDCPFAYWCERTARFKTPPETGEILDRLTLGNVMHEIWRLAAERVFSAGSSHSAALISVWDGAVASLAREHPLLLDTRAARVASDLKNKMLAAAGLMDEMWERAREDGMSCSRMETEYALPSIETEHAVFTGRADRIDFFTLPEGEGAVIFDYKLGKNRGYGRSHQLAAYGAALRRSGVRVAGLCYICHGDASRTGSWSPEARDIFAPGTRGAGCGEMIDEAALLMAEADNLIASGRYEANYGSPSCSNCPYTAICRRGERMGDYDRAGDDGDE